MLCCFWDCSAKIFSIVSCAKLFLTSNTYMLVSLSSTDVLSDLKSLYTKSSALSCNLLTRLLIWLIQLLIQLIQLIRLLSILLGFIQTIFFFFFWKKIKFIKSFLKKMGYNRKILAIAWSFLLVLFTHLYHAYWSGAKKGLLK